MSFFDLIPKVVSRASLAAGILLALGLVRADAQMQQPGNSSAGTLQAGSQANLYQGGTSGTTIEGNIDREAGPVNIMFLLDCSYSMKEKFEGSEKKMNGAKQVLEEAMSRIPPDVNVGLRVFGQGYAGIEEIDCSQTSCLVPLGTHNRSSIISRLRNLEPFGLTPLTYALRQCANDDFRTSQGPKTIILISDGADTCGGDPCAFVAVLERQYGVRIKIDIVGLALRRDPKARNQLDCIAQRSGGKYYDANSSGQLIESVAHSVDKAISGRVLPREGKPATSPPPTSTPNQSISPTNPPTSTSPATPVTSPSQPNAGRLPQP